MNEGKARREYDEGDPEGPMVVLPRAGLCGRGKHAKKAKSSHRNSFADMGVAEFVHVVRFLF